MIPKDKNEVAAFVSAGQGNMGREFIATLERMLSHLDKDSRKQTGETILVTNGKRQLLEEIISSLHGARDEFERIKHAPS